MHRRCFVWLFVLALVGSACAGSSADTGVVAADQADAQPSDADSDASSDSEASTSQASTSQGDDSSDDGNTTGAADPDGPSMAESSPIGAFFSEDGGFESALAEYTNRVEEAIVVCMAAQGFEFARSENNTGNPVQDRQGDLTEREWTTEFGYGISTSFDSVTQNLTSNPNFSIFMGMGDSEQEQWAFTLNGVGVEALLGGGPVNNELPLEEQGCIGQSLIETGGQDALEGLGDFGDVYAEGEAALFERRDMVDAVDAWTRCMSAAGYPDYATLDDPEEDITERFGVITAPLAGAQDLTDEEGQALLDGDTLSIESIENLDVDALREVQADEIELALVDLDCYEAEVKTIFEPLRDDFENGLLTEFSAEFDALRNIGS